VPRGRGTQPIEVRLSGCVPALRPILMHYCPACRNTSTELLHRLSSCETSDSIRAPEFEWRRRPSLACQAPLPQRGAGGPWCLSVQGDRFQSSDRCQGWTRLPSMLRHQGPPAGVRNLTFIKHTRRAVFFVLHARRRRIRLRSRVVGGLASLFIPVRSDTGARTMVPVRL